MHHVSMTRTKNNYKIGGLSLLTLIGIVIAFWKTLTYPYVQDDWFFISRVAGTDPFKVLIEAFLPFGKVHYRPFNTLFFLVSYNLLGINSIGYHILALVIHFCNTLLIVYIVQTINRSTLIAWATGILYSISVPIHMEPFLWAVGIQAFGCALFFYVSIALFLKNKTILSSFSYLFALFFQEGGLFLSLILFFYILLLDKWISLKHTARKIASKMWPHGLVLVLYLVLKIQGKGYSGLPETSPYKMKFLGLHVIRNSIFYCKWAVDAIFPFKDLPWGTKYPHLWKMEFSQLAQPATLLFILTVIITLTLSLYSFRFRRSNTPSQKNTSFVFWGIWLIGSIGPALFFPNQIYRYYLTFALMPFIVITLTGLRSIAHSLKWKESYFTTFIIFYTALITISSAHCFNSYDSEGINHKYRGGDNNLIKKGHIVRILWEKLLHNHPTLPHNAVFIFEKKETLWAIGFVDGLRQWYNDDTIMVAHEELLNIDYMGIYIDDPIWIRFAPPMISGKKSNKRVYLDPERTFVFRFQNGRLRENEFSSLYSK